MKILVVCQYYHPEPFRITDICETLKAKGHQVTVLTGLPNYPQGRVLAEYRFGRKRKETLNGVEILRCFLVGRGKNRVGLLLNYVSFALSASLKALFLRRDFDVVFAYQLSPVLMCLPAMVYKRRFKKKMVLYCLDLWPASLTAGGIKESSIVFKVFLSISKWIYNSADTLLVSSGMFKEYFLDILGIKSANIIHLPQYAEEVFKSSQVVKKAKEGFTFMFAGNVGDMQSVETIIKAANELRENKNISFQIIGDGSRLAQCKKLASELDVKNILFLGRRPVEEMPMYYEKADAMLVTLKNDKYLSYTLPGKVQSYLAAGKPIVGAINGETARVIEEAGCGYCCKAEDYKELAAIILMFSNSNEKLKMAQAAREMYQKEYRKEQFMQILENAFV